MLQNQNCLVQELKLTQFDISGYNVSATFIGKSVGDPSEVPSKYIEYLSENVLDQYGDPYFVNVSYNGFEKTNSSVFIQYAYLQSEGETVFDTIFTFSVEMNLQVGSDEKHVENVFETTESEEVAE